MSDREAEINMGKWGQAVIMGLISVKVTIKISRITVILRSESGGK